MTYVDVHRRLSTYDKDCAFRSIATQVLPYVGSFFAFVRNFFDILTHLKLSYIFVVIFGGFSLIFGGLGEGFGEDFGRIFNDFW